jgi:hypothetical protein
MRDKGEIEEDVFQFLQAELDWATPAASPADDLTLEEVRSYRWVQTAKVSRVQTSDIQGEKESGVRVHGDSISSKL